MKYAVDRIIEDIVVLENLDSKEMLEVNINLVPEGIKDGSILVFSDGIYHLDIDEEIKKFHPSLEVEEVEDAISGYRNSIKQIVALRQTVNQNEETLRLSVDLYKQGLTPFQNVLDAQRTLLSYRNNLVQAQGSSLQALINLYTALGGGWQYPIE